MGDELGGFLDREQLLGGSPARRAATLLFLIETRAARLVAQDRQRLVRPLTDESADERALEFVEAFAAGREGDVQPSVHDLERQSGRWASLVPHNPRLQAALARRLADKYRFTRRVAPGIRKALGLDDAEVAQAYQELHGEPVESVYVERLRARERVRWAWTGIAGRLEGMPPFWTAYSLTLTETVATDILALPIAFAAIGPLPAIVVLVVIGLLNVFTVCLMAESVVRTGPMRYRNAYLGRLFESNLGRLGSLPASALLILSSFLWIPVCYVGLGRTLGGVTSVPASVWVAVLFGATLLYLRRGSLHGTMATALAVGAINLVLILAMAAIVLPHVTESNVLHSDAPFLHGQPFEASAVALVLGVALMAYFGHLSAATCGSLVLERDPSGRSLIRASAAAQVTAIGLYCIFVFVANGALGADALAGADGTVVDPLADVAGPAVAVLGSTFVIVSLGLSSVIEGLTLSWLMKERLPSAARVVVLPRRRARLLFRARMGGFRVALTYLGPGRDGARFAVEREDRTGLGSEELAIKRHGDLLEGGRHRLALEVLEADERRARIAVTSTLPMSYEGELDGAGLDLAEVLSLTDAEASLAASLARTGEADVAAVAGRIGKEEGETLLLLESLAARGLVESRQTPAGRIYSARMAPRRPRGSEVWTALTDGVESASAAGRGSTRGRTLGGFSTLLAGRTGRFVVSVAPLTLAFAVSEWLVVSGTGSFAGLLSFLGVILVSLIAGLYPVLLIIASRRNGEYAPDPVRGCFGWPVLLALVYLVFLALLVAHAAVIWTDPAQRVGAALAALAMVAIPVALVRAGAFARRVTVEVRDDQGAGNASFGILAGERVAPGRVRLDYGDHALEPETAVGEIPSLAGLHRAVFELDREAPGERVKTWVHRVTPEGETEALSATARVLGVDETANLALSRGEAIFPFTSAELEVEIALREFGGAG